MWLALLFTTFIVCPTLGETIETGKYFYFAFVVAAALLFTTYCLLRKKISLHICFTDIAVFIFSLWVVANCIINKTHPGMSLWLFLLMVSLYVIIRASLYDSNMIRPLIWCILIVITVEAIWGLLQLYGILEPYHVIFTITGSFFNPGPYAGFLACGVPFALLCVFNGRRRAEKILGIICLISVILILPATMSRAAWLAVVAGSIPIILHQSKIKNQKPLARRSQSKITKVIFLVFTALFIAGAFFAMYSFKKHSADGRILIWKVSAEMIYEKPLTGFGLGSFQVKYDHAQAKFFLSGKGSEKQRLLADTPEYAFNEYIQITVEHGIIGLLLFLVIIFSFLRFAPTFSSAEPIKNQKSKFVNYLPAVNGSLITFLVFAFFSYPFSILPLTILFVILAAMSASLNVDYLNFTLIKNQKSKFINCIICLGLTGYASVEILTRYPAYKEWGHAQTLYESDEYEQAIEKYRRLYPKLNRQKQYLFEYAQCLSAIGQYEKGNELLGRVLLFGSDPAIFCCMGDNYKNMNDYRKSENMYQCASEIIPSLYYPLYLLMMLYHETGQNEKAQLMAKTLLEKPVKVPSKEISNIQEEAKKIRNMKFSE